MTGEKLLSEYLSVMMNAFGLPSRVFTKGEGARVWDSEGREYIDLLSGLAVLGLGHANSAVTDAVSRQLNTLGHISNLFASEPQINLAKRLVEALGKPDGRVFFVNFGSEANETAFKLSRLTGRTKLIAMEDSFHGRTSAALALTHNLGYREPFSLYLVKSFSSGWATWPVWLRL